MFVFLTDEGRPFCFSDILVVVLLVFFFFFVIVFSVLFLVILTSIDFTIDINLDHLDFLPPFDIFLSFAFVYCRFVVFLANIVTRPVNPDINFDNFVAPNVDLVNRFANNYDSHDFCYVYICVCNYFVFDFVYDHFAKYDHNDIYVSLNDFHDTFIDNNNFAIYDIYSHDFCTFSFIYDDRWALRLEHANLQRRRRKRRSGLIIRKRRQRLDKPLNKLSISEQCFWRRWRILLRCEQIEWISHDIRFRRLERFGRCVEIALSSGQQ